MSRTTVFFALLVVTSVFIPALATAGSDMPRYEADLAIDQPHYITSDVVESELNNETAYLVNGTVQEIQTLNFNRSDVVYSGVEQSDASFEYSETHNEYVLDTHDGVGKYHLYWVVNESYTVSDGNNTVVKERKVRYEAELQVENPDLAFTTEYNHNSAKRKAAKWDDWANELEIIYGPNVDVEKRTQEAVIHHKFTVDPYEMILKSQTLFVTVHSIIALLALFAVLIFGGYE